ncbi:hypothetical protein [Streptomyces atratus]|uniref:hypothetical protein n=1 Tax=Streptomyces atratus TaxID=1893 RepID=UPI00386BAC6A
MIGTIRREALDHVLILGGNHARKVLTDYQDHCNGHRPHRSRQRLPPSATEQPAIVRDLDGRSMLRTRVLGGLINEYRYAARTATTRLHARRPGGQETGGSAGGDAVAGDLLLPVRANGGGSAHHRLGPPPSLAGRPTRRSLRRPG